MQPSHDSKFAPGTHGSQIHPLSASAELYHRMSLPVFSRRRSSTTPSQPVSDTESHIFSRRKSSISFTNDSSPSISSAPLPSSIRRDSVLNSHVLNRRDSSINMGGATTRRSSMTGGRRDSIISQGGGEVGGIEGGWGLGQGRPVKDIPTRVTRELTMRNGRLCIVIHPGEVTLRGNGLSNSGRVIHTTPVRDPGRRLAALGGSSSLMGVQCAAPIIRNKMSNEMRAVQLLQRFNGEERKIGILNVVGVRGGRGGFQA